MWRDLPESEKQEFIDEYESEKIEYERAVKDYHASATYQAYLSAKNKGMLQSLPHGRLQARSYHHIPFSGVNDW